MQLDTTTTSLGIISLLCFSACSDKQKEANQQQEDPNIIMISADDLGWSDLGCYGSEIETPNLDSLAENGMRFTRFYNTSKSFPSRACLLTGLYAQQCGYGQSHDNPISNAVTLGEVLKKAGYRTLWAGKHHGAEKPVNIGFDRYYGLKDGCCNYFNPGDQREGEGKPAHKKWAYPREWCIDDSLYTPFTPEAEDFYTTDYFTNYSINWLEQYKNEDKPFFLYLAYTAPHDPLMAWPEDIARYEGEFDGGYQEVRQRRYKNQLKSGLLDASLHKLPEPAFTPWDSLSPEKQAEQEKIMEVYAAMIDRMDQNIGRLLRKLKELGEAENTLIMFASDNGASAEVVGGSSVVSSGEIGTLTRWASLGENWANVSNTPFRYYKNYSYEGGINTPFIAYWPEHIEPNSKSDFPGHFIDLMATAVDIAGAKYPEKFEGEKIHPYEGKSLLPAFQGQSMKREKPLFFQWSDGRALHMGKWKIVKEGVDNPWKLYNIDKDPTETTDLSDKNPDVVNRLDSLHRQWRTRVQKAPE